MIETVSRSMVSHIVDALYGHDYRGWSSSIDRTCETCTYEESAIARLTVIVVCPNPRNKIKQARTNLFIRFFETDAQYHIKDVVVNPGKLDIIETNHTVAIPILREVCACFVPADMHPGQYTASTANLAVSRRIFIVPYCGKNRWIRRR